MTYQRALLAAILAIVCLIQGCVAGNSDSGPTAEGSGAPAPSSGAAGSAPYAGAGAGAGASR